MTMGSIHVLVTNAATRLLCFRPTALPPLLFRLTHGQYRHILHVLAEIETVGEEPLRLLLEQLGGWPVVSRQWREEEWNLEATIAILRGLYNAPILIDSWVAADDKNSSVHILQVHVSFR